MATTAGPRRSSNLLQAARTETAKAERADGSEGLTCGGCEGAVGMGEEFARVGAGAYHLEHLCCERCVVPLGRGGRYVEKGGFPYCATCTQQDLPLCRGCRLPIAGDVLLAMEGQWHPEHFQCATCQKPLNELFGVRSFYTLEGRPYCEADYGLLVAQAKAAERGPKGGAAVPGLDLGLALGGGEGKRGAVAPPLRLKTPRTRALSFSSDGDSVRAAAAAAAALSRSEGKSERETERKGEKGKGGRKNSGGLLGVGGLRREVLSVTKNYSFGIARSHGMIGALAADRRGSFLLPKETREEYVRVTAAPETAHDADSAALSLTPSLSASAELSPAVPSIAVSVSVSSSEDATVPEPKAAPEAEAAAVPEATDTPSLRLGPTAAPALEFLAPSPAKGSADKEEAHEAPAKCLLSSAKAIESLDDVLEVGEVIGKGGFAIVKKAVARATGEEVAVKLFNKWELQQGDALVFLEREISTLREISHPNIRELREVYEDQHYIYVVMEYVAGESLFELVERVDTLSEKDTQEVVRALLEVLAYMHAAHYIHQDVKTENMMIPAGSAAPFRDMKVIDFGFARVVPPGETLREYCGSYHYLAPEMISRQPYDLKVDLWSVGVVTYILLTGLRPFFSQAEAMSGSIQWFDEDWEVLSKEAREFVVALLTVDPAQRLDAAQALAHPWFS
eukprot:CAMPEP_0114619232 /NCGR_PEP_ID=MMETSP0168-20121206/8109_1 /TAXON_ID=95228 ORGANISM="Vannella sp., Strain DIVA3 517/6/12" /NCGR_SAMPLE_ID=MMETSP0168 /ASSEMBLY_ACC=CAM_ASM_000044 /LENGTH=678 /DNA_ID=CAMNT_0001830397 /DNA_START=326 /DNA_END=2358 /DNA_ORIENTATION=-